MNYIQSTKTISSSDLYNNYPLSSYFANCIACQPFLSISVSSFKELLLQSQNLEVTEFDENSENSLEVYCFGCTFILRENTIYYYQPESHIYLNLGKIEYFDIIVSSVLYVVKKNELDCWWVIGEFLLESSFEEKLSFYLKKENLVIQYRKNFILGLINSFKEIETAKRVGLLSKNKKYCKKRILNILALLDVNESEALILIEKYQSISSDSYVIINFLKNLLK